MPTSKDPNSSKKENKNGKVYIKLDKDNKPTDKKAHKLKDSKGNIINP